MSERDDIEREMAEKGLQHAVWLALFFAQRLPERDDVTNQLTVIFDKLHSGEIPA